MRRRALAILAFGLPLVLPASSSAQTWDFHMGGFFPSTNSNLFNYDFSVYTASKNDFDGFIGGVQFNQKVAHNVEIGVFTDLYWKHVNTYYQGFTYPGGGNIYQTLFLQEWPVGVTVRFIPTNRRTRIAPFIGFGGDLIFWTYSETGNFIDPTSLAISSNYFESTGVSPAFHVEGGLRIPLSYDLQLVATGKYMWCKTSMGGGFAGNTIDLGGATATLGLNFHF